MKRQWAVYYRTREYARVMGDPCLGYVWVSSVGEALDVARVVPCQEKEKTGKEKTGVVLVGVSPVGAVDSLRVKQERWSRESE